jgi:hypothetical protein
MLVILPERRRVTAGALAETRRAGARGIDLEVSLPVYSLAARATANGFRLPPGAVGHNGRVIEELIGRMAALLESLRAAGFGVRLPAA